MRVPRGLALAHFTLLFLFALTQLCAGASLLCPKASTPLANLECEYQLSQVVGRSRPAIVVSPQCTDPNISALSVGGSGLQYMHYVYKPTKKAAGKLWLHLPGSLDHPLDTQFLAGSSTSYHTIHLAYNTSVALETSYCNSSLPAALRSECFWDIRYQMVTGSSDSMAGAPNRTRLYTGTPPGNFPADSIMHRLLALLQLLACRFPKDGWDNYLTTNKTAVAWERVIVSGHSQGGGHAGVLAFLQPVARVTLLSSICDASNWTSGVYHSQSTPRSRWFGLHHEQEGIVCNKTLMFNHWSKVGVLDFGPPANASARSYAGSHALTVSLTPECVTSQTTYPEPLAFALYLQHLQAAAGNSSCGILCAPDIKQHMSTASDVCVPRVSSKVAAYSKRAWPYVLGFKKGGTAG